MNEKKVDITKNPFPQSEIDDVVKNGWPEAEKQKLRDAGVHID
jgi:hypothetical protein